MRFRYVLISALVFVAAAAIVHADTVILNSGARLQGEVTEVGPMIRVTNENGTHSIRRSRVARLIRSNSNPGNPASNPTGRNRNLSQRGTRGSRADGVASAAEGMLARRISVDFQEAPVTAVMEYLSEVTEANFSYNPRLLDAQPPVTLNLQDVTVRQVLDLVVEERDINWAMRDNIIRVREGHVVTAEIRIYDVRDLMVNVEDKDAPVVRTARGAADTDRDNDLLVGGGWQDDFDDDWDFDRGRNGGVDQLRRTPTQSLQDRARDLGGLITSTVRPRSWADPAIVVIGGVQQRGEGQVDGDPVVDW